MKKAVIAGIVLIITGLLIALVAGGGAPPPGAPPGGGNQGGISLVPRLGQPFNFSGVVKEVNPETQQFLLVNHPVNEPKDLERRLTELINVRPFQYERQTINPEILRNDSSARLGIRKAEFGEIQPHQSVSAGGVVKGFTEGNSQYELDAAQVHIVQDDYLEYKESTYGLGIVTIEEVNDGWITISGGQTIKVMPGCEIKTHDTQGREISFTGELTPGTKITLHISSRLDRDYEYTNWIFVH